ncbi:hypothetical protein C0J52_27454 [Blattella germanica]|nr:hypothetical protein C0J52_27454 [Blattella germanica]
MSCEDRHTLDWLITPEFDDFKDDDELLNVIMIQRKSVPTLKKLSFVAISSFFSLIVNKVLLKYCSKKSRALQSYKTERVDLDLSLLKSYLHDSVPRDLAIKMMHYLLRGILITIDRMTCTVDRFKTTGDNVCKDIIEAFILISINPYTTYLDLSKQPQVIRKMLCQHLNEMPNLEVLSARTCEEWESIKITFLKELAAMKRLISFNMEIDCTDEIIETLGRNCQMLKCLIVNGAVRVTDRCIFSILKLQQLEQLELSATSLTEKGFISLLNELAKNATVKIGEKSEKSKISQMKSLGCDLIRSTTLAILLNHYLNLTHLRLSSLHCDLSQLKELEHLQHLRLTGGNFLTDNVKGLIQEKGVSLQLLDFLLVQNIDLVWMGKYCTELKSLSLRSCTFMSDTPIPETKSEEPIFQKLEMLTFYVQFFEECLHFLLVNCTNIKRITISTKEVNDEFMAKAMQNNKSMIREKMKVKGSLTEDIKTSQLRLFGHIKRMWQDRLPKKIFEWQPMGRRKRGRLNITWTERIRISECESCFYKITMPNTQIRRCCGIDFSLAKEADSSWTRSSRASSKMAFVTAFSIRDLSTKGPLFY